MWLSPLGVHHCCGMGHAVLHNRRAHTGCQTPSARGREQATPAAVIANRPPPPAAMNRVRRLPPRPRQISRAAKKCIVQNGKQICG